MKRRHEFIWTIRNAYEDLKQMRTARAVLLFGGLSVVLFWFFFALEPLLTLINRFVARFVLSWFPQTISDNVFLEAVLHILMPLLLLVPFLVWLQNRYKEKPIPKMYVNRVAPEPHRGLIFLLSPYRRRVPPDVAQQLGVPNTAEDLHALLQREEQGSLDDFRRIIFATTWGTLWAAVQHHRPELQHCWLICSEGEDGSKQQAETAELLVRKAAVGPVQCYYDTFSIGDAHDISEIVPVVDRIYTKALPAVDLDEDQVIADITGGTGAMSAATAMATIDRERKIEYLRQDKQLLVKEGDHFRPRAPDEIREEPILIMVETWRELVPRHAEES